MTRISVIEGDITAVTADALLTVINSGGMWFGGIDSAIQRVAGGMFHAEVAEQRPLHDGEAFYIQPTLLHGGNFMDVIFVIDDLQQPLSNIVRAGLELAVDNGLKSITIPTIRTGVMSGVVETHEEALTSLASEVGHFADSETLQEITIVVYNNPADVEFLKRALSAKV